VFLKQPALLFLKRVSVFNKARAYAVGKTGGFYYAVGFAGADVGGAAHGQLAGQAGLLGGGHSGGVKPALHQGALRPQSPRA